MNGGTHPVNGGYAVLMKTQIVFLAALLALSCGGEPDLSKDTLQRGNVISIEPGLYYPEQGFGIRVEDTFYVSENGELISLTDFHKELVLPLKG